MIPTHWLNEQSLGRSIAPRSESTFPPTQTPRVPIQELKRYLRMLRGDGHGKGIGGLEGVSSDERVCWTPLGLCASDRRTLVPVRPVRHDVLAPPDDPRAPHLRGGKQATSSQTTPAAFRLE